MDAGEGPVGVSISDILYILLTYSGITHLSENPDFKFALAFIGGLIMAAFGVRMFTRPVFDNTPRIALNNSGSKVRKIAKGFILNGVNPFVLIFWIGTSTLVTLHWNYSSGQAFIFFLSLVLTTFITDVGKVYLADRIRPSVNHRFIRNLNRAVGIAFIILGARMLIYAFYHGDQIFAGLFH